MQGSIKYRGYATRPLFYAKIVFRVMTKLLIKKMLTPSLMWILGCVCIGTHLEVVPCRETHGHPWTCDFFASTCRGVFWIKQHRPALQSLIQNTPLWVLVKKITQLFSMMTMSSAFSEQSLYIGAFELWRICVVVTKVLQCSIGCMRIEVGSTSLMGGMFTNDFTVNT